MEILSADQESNQLHLELLGGGLTVGRRTPLQMRQIILGSRSGPKAVIASSLAELITASDVPAQAFSGIGGIDDLEKKWHDMQKEYGA